MKIKPLITILVFMFCQTLSSQKIITYDNVLNELLNSTEVYNISIYSFQLESKSKIHTIELNVGTVLTEPAESIIETQITHVDADSIINYLDSNGLLENLYVRINDHYTNIKNTKDTFNIKEPIIFIEIFYSYNNEKMQVYLKSTNKQSVDKLLRYLNELTYFRCNHFFIEFSKIIRKLEDNENL